MGGLINLHEHCFLLSYLMAELDHTLPDTSGTDYTWPNASDWLKIAAGVGNVEIDTLRFDDCPFCPTEYEDKRSELLTQMVTRLTTFNFVWGAFETVIKIIDPDDVPRNIKPRSSVIDNAIYYLKNEFDLSPRIPLYYDTLAQFRLVLLSDSLYKKYVKEFKIDSFMSISGLGVHIVRKIRNSFAHGSTTLPEPDDWDSKAILSSELRHLDLIEISSRLILFSIQMMLTAKFKNNDFKVECLRDVKGRLYVEDISVVLRVLHRDDYRFNPKQLRLFN